MGPNFIDYSAPINSDIQRNSERIANCCGEPNKGEYCGCFVGGRSYEQFEETTVLTYLESASRDNESYQEKQQRLDAYLAGKKEGTVLFAPTGGVASCSQCR